MHFIKQTNSSDCHIVVIQTVLTHFSISLSKKDIKLKLPKSKFATLPQIAIYLESIGINTKIVSNNANINLRNKSFINSLEKYKDIGIYEDRLININDISNLPIIINIDCNKVLNKSLKPEAHYIVILREDNDIYLYDGINYSNKVSITFNELLRISKDINYLKDDGMWLMCF